MEKRCWDDFDDEVECLEDGYSESKEECMWLDEGGTWETCREGKLNFYEGRPLAKEGNGESQDDQV